MKNGGANMNPIEKIVRVTKPEAKIDAIVGTPSPPSVKDQKTREDYHLFSSYAGGRHGRATRILGYCLTLNAPDTWLGATAIWKKCLTMAEIVGLAYSVMSGLPREIAVIVTESALEGAGQPHAPLLGFVDQAIFWADMAEPKELEAYCLASFAQMKPRRQKAFLEYVQGHGQLGA